MQINKFENIFLDRDGVINEVILRDGIVSSPRSLKEFCFKRDIKDFVKRFRNKKFFIVTNQPDLSRNLLDISELTKMHSLIRKELGICRISFCPHVDEHNCNCRKPKAGMIINYIHSLNLDISKCIMIGDTEKDILAAKNAKISSVLIKTDYNDYVAGTNYISSLKDLK